MRGDPDSFLDSVETHIRAAIERCGDRWGRNTGLLADGFSLRDGEPLRWEEAIVSDLNCQQNLLRALDGLAAVRGEDEWRDVAGEWIGSALTRLTDAESGLLTGEVTRRGIWRRISRCVEITSSNALTLSTTSCIGQTPPQ